MSVAPSTSSLEIVIVPCLPSTSKNYAYLLHDAVSSQTAVVDPTDLKPIKTELETRNWRLTHIINTHHHWDHTGGNLGLKEIYDAKVTSNFLIFLVVFFSIHENTTEFFQFRILSFQGSGI